MSIYYTKNTAFVKQKLKKCHLKNYENLTIEYAPGKNTCGNGFRASLVQIVAAHIFASAYSIVNLSCIFFTYFPYLFDSASATRGGTMREMSPPNWASCFIDDDFTKAYFSLDWRNTVSISGLRF